VGKLFSGGLFLGKEFVGELFAGVAVAHVVTEVAWDTSQGVAGKGSGYALSHRTWYAPPLVNRMVKFTPWKEPEVANEPEFDIQADDEEVMLVLMQSIGALYG
jgi:hypothetical protein